MKNLFNVSLLCLIIFSLSCMNKPASASATPEPVDIGGKTWKLTELYGQPIQLKDPKRNPYLTLNMSDMRYEGNGGCNGLSGTFEIKPDLMRIKFNQGISTMMACDDLDIEKQFTKALLATDNYSVKGNILTLNRARMAPLAKFVLQNQDSK